MLINTVTPSEPRTTQYQEVEYIESDGISCGIDTGIIPRNSPYLKIEFKMMPTTIKSINNYFYGADRNDENNSYISFEYLSGYNAYWNVGSSIFQGQHSMSAGSIYEYSITYNNGSFSVSGSKSYSTTYSGNLGAANENLCFFCGADGLRGQSAEKLYYLKIYQGQNFDLVRDFVPCYRKSDSVIGLYDLVNNTFYTNAGTGTFTKGSDV